MAPYGRDVGRRIDRIAVNYGQVRVERRSTRSRTPLERQSNRSWNAVVTTVLLVLIRRRLTSKVQCSTAVTQARLLHVDRKYHTRLADLRTRLPGYPFSEHDIGLHNGVHKSSWQPALWVGSAAVDPQNSPLPRQVIVPHLFAVDMLKIQSFSQLGPWSLYHRNVIQNPATTFW